jgi:protein Tob/BTG
VMYWVEALNKQHPNLPPWKLTTFRDTLFNGIQRRVEGHWYPDDPNRGQGYRALLCAERVDGILVDALQRAQLSFDFRAFGEHVVMYIDPGNVSLRVSSSYNAGRRGEVTTTLFPAA